MIEKTCGACRYWAGNEYLMGGPCELNGGIRYPGSTCDKHEFRVSLAEKFISIWIWLLFASVGIGTAYFCWFLFYRAGFFG